MNILSHLITGGISVVLSHLAWEDHGKRHNLPVFMFEIKTNLVCWGATIVFPLVVMESDFRKPIPLVCVLVLEIVCFVISLYVSTVRIVLDKDHFDESKFFKTRRIAYRNIKSIQILPFWQIIIVKLEGGGHFTFSSEIPRAMLLFEFLKHKHIPELTRT